MTEEGTVAECGFCNSSGEALQAPETLDCGHTHCSSCLKGDVGTDGVTIACPKCKSAAEVEPSDLPPETDNFCDICLERKQENVLAVSYCLDDNCKKRYCDKHKEFHNEVLAGHNMIDIGEFSSGHTTSQKRLCSRHNNAPLTEMGCRKCGTSLCAHCIDDAVGCEGNPHHVTTLRTLASEVEGKVDELRKKVTTRQDELSELSERSDSILTEYDNETEGMVQRVNTTRDEQINALREKYTELEASVLSQRKDGRAEIAEFKDLTVQAQLTELLNSLEYLDSSVRQCHESDIAGKFRETEIVIQPLLDNDLPSLTVRKPQIELHSKGEFRNIELYVMRSGKTLGIKSPKVKSADGKSKQTVNGSIGSSSAGQGDNEASTSESKTPANNSKGNNQNSSRKRKRDASAVGTSGGNRYTPLLVQPSRHTRQSPHPVRYLRHSTQPVNFSQHSAQPVHFPRHPNQAIRFPQQANQPRNYRSMPSQPVRFSPHQLQGVRIQAQSRNYPQFPSQSSSAVQRYGR